MVLKMWPLMPVSMRISPEELTPQSARFAYYYSHRPGRICGMIRFLQGQFLEAGTR